MTWSGSAHTEPGGHARSTDWQVPPFAVQLAGLVPPAPVPVDDMSPGSVTEILYFFVAEYSKAMKIGEGGGVEHEEENIEVLEMAMDKAMNMIATGEIKDGKTIMLLQYLKLNNLL